jgi:diguanylate cyclase (GGDEF)-like protein/PAS domain S-box-containing protein
MKKNPHKHTNNTHIVHELISLRHRLLDLENKEEEQKRLIDILHESEEKYRILLDESSDPIFSFTPDGEYRYVNKSFADGVGRRLEDIIHKKIWDVFPLEEANKRYATVKWVFENGITKVIEVRVPRTDGDRYYITTAKPILNEQGKVVSVMCISKEITDRKRMEKELLYLSTHDILTGLYNRNFFEVELGRLQISRLFPISIVISDMDHLKLVNDTFGHSTGDELLRKTAGILRQSFRAEEIISRIGGDEFVVLLPTTDETATLAAVNRLRSHLDEQHDPRLQLSIGIATGIEGSNLVDVMRLADDRMYQEKASHKNRNSQ